jgi:putative SOS response-associated peptidase YedK
MTVKAFNSDSPLNERRIVIRRSGEDVEMIDLPWSLQPGEPGARRYAVLRAEDRIFPSHRSLVTASEFRHRSHGQEIIASVWFYLFRRNMAPGDP